MLYYGLSLLTPHRDLLVYLIGQRVNVLVELFYRVQLVAKIFYYKIELDIISTKFVSVNTLIAFGHPADGGGLGADVLGAEGVDGVVAGEFEWVEWASVHNYYGGMLRTN